MFETFLASIPKNRSEMVNDLELPEDITVTPYIWTEPDESLLSDSPITTSIEEYDLGSRSSDSSLALSRAMTDSEIDYERYRRFKTRSFSDPWLQMRVALDHLPPEYLESVNSFRSSSELTDEVGSVEGSLHVEELRLKMEKFFDEECRVFTPDDPGLMALEEALKGFELKNSDLESITP